MPRSSVAVVSTAAPAPSPKSTQVARSVQSVIGRQKFGAEHKPGFRAAAGNQQLAVVQREEKAGAGGADVVGDGVGGAQRFLDEDRRGRETHVGRDRAEDNEIEFVGGNASFVHGDAGGLNAVVGGLFAALYNMPFLDAAAGGDPLVIGFDDLFKIGVGQDGFGNGFADTGDADGRAGMYG